MQSDGWCERHEMLDCGCPAVEVLEVSAADVAELLIEDERHAELQEVRGV